MNTLIGTYSIEYTSHQDSQYDCVERCHEGRYCKKTHKCTFPGLPVQIVKEEAETIVSSINVECDGSNTCTVRYSCGDIGSIFHEFCIDNCDLFLDPTDPSHPYYNCYSFDLNDPCPQIPPMVIPDPISSSISGDTTFKQYKLLYLNENELHLSSVYPNPFKDQIDITFFAYYTGRLNVYLFNAFGRKVKEHHIITNEGKNLISINVQNFLPSGLYYLIITDEFNNRHSQKLMHINQ